MPDKNAPKSDNLVSFKIADSEVQHLGSQTGDIHFFEHIGDMNASFILAQDELGALKLLDTHTLDVIKVNKHALVAT